MSMHFTKIKNFKMSESCFIVLLLYYLHDLCTISLEKQLFAGHMGRSLKACYIVHVPSIGKILQMTFGNWDKLLI